MAAGLGFGLGYGAYALFNSFWLGSCWSALPFFLLIHGHPACSSFRASILVFESSAWTLAYRDLRPALEPGQEVIPAAPQRFRAAEARLQPSMVGMSSTATGGSSLVSLPGFRLSASMDAG
ncbi:MAG: hypothetical protein V9H69_16600 [Anaerolineae bacterium]